MSREGLCILAKLLGLDFEEMEKAILNPDYRQIFVNKENGSKRKLNVPGDKFKHVQRCLLDRLLMNIPVSEHAHCSVRGRSVVTNAKVHQKSNFFFKVDFKDAFPSTTKRIIKDSLLRHMVLLRIKEEREAVIELISDIVSYKGYLPQGAPASPYVMNIVCKDLDMLISNFCIANNMVYSRYMDDVWCSSKSPITIEYREAIIDIIGEYGYTINPKKTSYVQSTEYFQPDITGVRILKSGLAINSVDIEKYRTAIHKAATDWSIKDSEIFGMLGWVCMVEGKIPSRLQKAVRYFCSLRCPDKLSKYLKMF